MTIICNGCGKPYEAVRRGQRGLCVECRKAWKNEYRKQYDIRRKAENAAKAAMKGSKLTNQELIILENAEAKNIGTSYGEYKAAQYMAQQNEKGEGQ